MSQTRSRSNSYKAAAAIAASAYYWTCEGCANKNSNYSDVCFGCRGPKPASAFKFTRNGSSKSTNYTSLSSTKQTTKLPPPKSFTPPSTRIVPITIEKKSTVTTTKKPSTSKAKELPPTSAYKSKQSSVILRNNDKSKSSVSKPRSVSVSADKFQEFVSSQRALSSDRRTLSTFTIGKENLIKPEVLDEVKLSIISSASSLGDRSKTALPLPLLHTTVLQLEGKFKSKIKSLQKEGTNFEDENFSKNRSSLYVSTEDSDPAYDRLIDKWLRLAEISFESVDDSLDSPKSLVVHGPTLSIASFRQGTIGDCWFICSLASLIYSHPSYLRLLVPDGSLHPVAGAYQLFLCLDGRWTSVEVDDYFPVDASKRLVFSQAVSTGTGSQLQLFAPLLEKALAKHHTAYKALSAGTVLEGFSNLTGMPVRRRAISIQGGLSTNDVNELWRYIHLHLKVLQYLLSGSCIRNTYGLHANHAYSILDVLSTADGGKALLLWNPWGRQELFGSLAQFNTMISKKYSGGGKFQPLPPGAFWLRFSDFCNNFSALDVCKLNTRWQCSRFELALPFDLSDGRNFTVFSLDVPPGPKGASDAHFEFTLYQKVHRDLQFKYRLDLSLVIFRRKEAKSGSESPFGPLEYVACSRVFDNKVASYGKKLPHGRYLVAVVGFNHWGATSRLKDAPRLVIAFHGSRKYQVTALNPDTSLLGDMLIELAIAVGERSNNETQNWCQYVVRKGFCSFLLVVENRNEKEHLVAEYNSTGSKQAFSSRSTLRTVDIIPPKCRQVITILSRECDKTSCTFSVAGKNFRNYVPPHLLSSNSVTVKVHPDVLKMPALFAPRLVSSALELERVNLKAQLPLTAESSSGDDEDDNTWKAAKRGSGCCIS